MKVGVKSDHFPLTLTLSLQERGRPFIPLPELGVFRNVFIKDGIQRGNG
jgi:hypothetical protein